MDQPIIPPEQGETLPRGSDAGLPDETDATKELPSVDDILREFSEPTPDAGGNLSPDEADVSVPSPVDDILNELSAPLAEIAEDADYQDAPAADDSLQAFTAPEADALLDTPLDGVSDEFADPAPAEEAAEPQEVFLPTGALTEEAPEAAPLDDILREFGAERAPAEEAPPAPSEALSGLYAAEEPSQAPAAPLYPADYPLEAPDSEPPTVVARPVQKKRSTARKVLHVFAVIGKYLLALVIAAVIAVAGLFGYLTLAEYNPAHAELAERGAVNVSQKLDKKTFSILTLNTGYGALGEDADFFMDGGKGVRGESEAQVRDNMLGIEAIVRSADADFVFLQEVDTDSARSFGLDQWHQYEYDLEKYETRFALNYSCDYVPYPIPTTIGRVHSGIATFSQYDISSATRYSLPCPFSWPTRIANLKRCMLVTRIPLDGSDGKELVLVNFHLEAYDDGEGKTAQTDQLMSYLREEYEKGNFVIAGGDFNQTFPGTQDKYELKPTSEWAAGQLDLLPTGWRYAYDSSTPTCRLLNQPYDPDDPLTQYYVIDGFIVSPNVELNSVKTLNERFVYTDHNPVLMEVTLTP
ncbi:MAG: endonuclease/exonuclease/phosphatase family protein [Oscillospiraceae bacterium]|nr:endonuclease/exonuclease/phosphatase family protein [Oscillospiraceae bacterium]